MLNPTYLTRSRHQIFYFRWPLPAAHRQEGKTTHIKLSLRTREPKEALRLANILEYHGCSLMKRPSISLMNYAELKDLVDRHFQEVLRGEKAEIDEKGPLSPYKVEYHKEIIARNSDIHAFEQFSRVMARLHPKIHDLHLQRLVEGTDLKLEIGTPLYNNLQEIHRIGAIAYREALLHYNEEKSRFSFSPAGGAENIHEPQSSDPLSAVIQKYQKEMISTGTWSLRAMEEREDCFEVLRELLGQATPFSMIGSVQARKVKETLMLLPKNRNKMAQTRGLPIQKQIKVDGVEKLSVGSVNKYLQCYSSLFLWGTRNAYTAKNPFEGLALKESSKKRRDQFTAEQMKAMLLELGAQKSKGQIADYAYWGALIGIYTGARLNEIASLTPDDVKQENGIWYFDINDEDEMKRLKTNAASRRVPIHSQLIELGFLEYVQTVKEMNLPEARILHNLTYSEKEGWGRKLGRWFNTTFLIRLGIKKKGLSFHSLRHTAITTMRRASIERPIVQAIVGHEPDGVTEEVYTHGYELSQLHRAIEALSFHGC